MCSIIDQEFHLITDLFLDYSALDDSGVDFDIGIDTVEATKLITASPVSPLRLA